MEVLRPERGRGRARHLVQRLLRRLRLPVGRTPALASDPRAVARLAPNLVERFHERRDSVQAQIALSQRPGRKVDMGVREAWEDAAAAEVHDVRGRQRRLVRSDPTGDTVAGDRERAGDGERRIHGADDAVFEDHGPRL